jgi:hypothetical protein
MASFALMDKIKAFCDLSAPHGVIVSFPLQYVIMPSRDATLAIMARYKM